MKNTNYINAVKIVGAIENVMGNGAVEIEELPGNNAILTMHPSIMNVLTQENYTFELHIVPVDFVTTIGVFYYDTQSRLDLKQLEMLDSKANVLVDEPGDVGIAFHVPTKDMFTPLVRDMIIHATNTLCMSFKNNKA